MTNSLQSLLKERIHANIQAHSAADKEFSDFAMYQAGKIEQIPLDKIKSNTSQPRLMFNDESIELLAISIDDVGLLQPISVRKKGNFFEIIAGERRFRAFQKLGKPVIDCIISIANDEQNTLLALAENLSREDLSDYEIAKSIIAFKSNFPSKSDYAKALGLSRQKLYKLLSFENLPKSILDKLNNQPILLSADTTEQLITLKKQDSIDDDTFTILLDTGLDLLINGKIKQSKLVEFIRGELNTKKKCPNSDTFERTIKHIYDKDGKSLAKIHQTQRKYVVELDTLNVSQMKAEAIEKFLQELLVTDTVNSEL